MSKIDVLQSPCLGCLYKLQELNYGQMIWDKMRCYWEHVGEHIKKFENMLGTHWEHYENTLETTKIQKIQHPLAPPSPPLSPWH